MSGAPTTSLAGQFEQPYGPRPGAPTCSRFPVLRSIKTYGLTHEQLAMVSVVHSWDHGETTGMRRNRPLCSEPEVGLRSAPDSFPGLDKAFTAATSTVERQR
jgi:hypothetical protein